MMGVYLVLAIIGAGLALYLVGLARKAKRAHEANKRAGRAW